MPGGARRPVVTLRRRTLSLSVEREQPGPAGEPERIRLSAELEVAGPDAGGPTPEQLREALAQLRSELDAVVGPAVPTGPAVPRSLEELVQAYRPRQPELVELLRAEHEISDAEAELLRSYLAHGEPPASPERAPLPPPTDRPLAAMPLANDRTPSTPRSVAQLLELYRIESLKQAGAVRARRQISYEEYMALKRHFAELEPGTGAAPGVAEPAGGTP